MVNKNQYRSNLFPDQNQKQIENGLNMQKSQSNQSSLKSLQRQQNDSKSFQSQKMDQTIIRQEKWASEYERLMGKKTYDARQDYVDVIDDEQKPRQLNESKILTKASNKFQREITSGSKKFDLIKEIQSENIQWSPSPFKPFSLEQFNEDIAQESDDYESFKPAKASSSKKLTNLKIDAIIDQQQQKVSDYYNNVKSLEAEAYSLSEQRKFLEIQYKQFEKSKQVELDLNKKNEYCNQFQFEMIDKISDLQKQILHKDRMESRNFTVTKSMIFDKSNHLPQVRVSSNSKYHINQELSAKKYLNLFNTAVTQQSRNVSPVPVVLRQITNQTPVPIVQPYNTLNIGQTPFKVSEFQEANQNLELSNNFSSSPQLNPIIKQVIQNQIPTEMHHHIQRRVVSVNPHIMVQPQVPPVQQFIIPNIQQVDESINLQNQTEKIDQMHHIQRRVVTVNPHIMVQPWVPPVQQFTIPNIQQVDESINLQNQSEKIDQITKDVQILKNTYVSHTDEPLSNLKFHLIDEPLQSEQESQNENSFLIEIQKQTQEVLKRNSVSPDLLIKQQQQQIKDQTNSRKSFISSEAQRIINQSKQEFTDGSSFNTEQISYEQESNLVIDEQQLKKMVQSKAQEIIRQKSPQQLRNIIESQINQNSFSDITLTEESDTSLLNQNYNINKFHRPSQSLDFKKKKIEKFHDDHQKKLFNKIYSQDISKNSFGKNVPYYEQNYDNRQGKQLNDTEQQQDIYSQQKNNEYSTDFRYQKINNNQQTDQRRNDQYLNNQKQYAQTQQFKVQRTDDVEQTKDRNRLNEANKQEDYSDESYQNQYDIPKENQMNQVKRSGNKLIQLQNNSTKQQIQNDQRRNEANDYYVDNQKSQNQQIKGKRNDGDLEDEYNRIRQSGGNKKVQYNEPQKYQQHENQENQLNQVKRSGNKKAQYGNEDDQQDNSDDENTNHFDNDNQNYSKLRGQTRDFRNKKNNQQMQNDMHRNQENQNVKQLSEQNQYIRENQYNDYDNQDLNQDELSLNSNRLVGVSKKAQYNQESNQYQNVILQENFMNSNKKNSDKKVQYQHDTIKQSIQNDQRRNEANDQYVDNQKSQNQQIKGKRNDGDLEDEYNRIRQSGGNKKVQYNEPQKYQQHENQENQLNQVKRSGNKKAQYGNEDDQQDNSDDENTHYFDNDNQNYSKLRGQTRDFRNKKNNQQMQNDQRRIEDNDQYFDDQNQNQYLRNQKEKQRPDSNQEMNQGEQDRLRQTKGIKQKEFNQSQLEDDLLQQNQMNRIKKSVNKKVQYQQELENNDQQKIFDNEQDYQIEQKHRGLIKQIGSQSKQLGQNQVLQMKQQMNNNETDDLIEIDSQENHIQKDVESLKKSNKKVKYEGDIVKQKQKLQNDDIHEQNHQNNQFQRKQLNSGINNEQQNIDIKQMEQNKLYETSNIPSFMIQDKPSIKMKNLEFEEIEKIYYDKYNKSDRKSKVIHQVFHDDQDDFENTEKRRNQKYQDQKKSNKKSVIASQIQEDYDVENETKATIILDSPVKNRKSINVNNIDQFIEEQAKKVIAQEFTSKSLKNSSRKSIKGSLIDQFLEEQSNKQQEQRGSQRQSTAKKNQNDYDNSNQRNHFQNKNTYNQSRQEYDHHTDYKNQYNHRLENESNVNQRNDQNSQRKQSNQNQRNDSQSQKKQVVFSDRMQSSQRSRVEPFSISKNETEEIDDCSPFNYSIDRFSNHSNMNYDSHQQQRSQQKTFKNSSSYMQYSQEEDENSPSVSQKHQKLFQEGFQFAESRQQSPYVMADSIYRSNIQQQQFQQSSQFIQIPLYENSQPKKLTIEFADNQSKEFNMKSTMNASVNQYSQTDLNIEDQQLDMILKSNKKTVDRILYGGEKESNVKQLQQKHEDQKLELRSQSSQNTQIAIGQLEKTQSNNSQSIQNQKNQINKQMMGIDVQSIQSIQHKNNADLDYSFLNFVEQNRKTPSMIPKEPHPQEQQQKQSETQSAPGFQQLSRQAVNSKEEPQKNNYSIIYKSRKMSFEEFLNSDDKKDNKQTQSKQSSLQLIPKSIIQQQRIETQQQKQDSQQIVFNKNQY